MVILAAVTGYARVFLGYHSVMQVILGCAVGTANAFAFFWLLDTTWQPYAELLLNTRIARILRVRNTIWKEFYQERRDARLVAAQQGKSA